MTNTTNTWVDLDDLDDVHAREYLRVSFDESGRVRSNDEQHDENVPLIERRGWKLGERYEDVGSASKYQRRRRPDFDRLLADLEGGTFDAHVLILWESSRGSRKVSEWSRMLEACETTGVRVFVTQHRWLYDPSVPRDWKALMDEAVDSEHESRKTSKRVRRSTNADAVAGRFGGGRRPFGFEADGVTVRTDEAAVIRDCVRAVIGGKTTRSIAADLNRQGITTSAGNAWHPGVLRKMLASPRLAGHRTHHGEIARRDAWPAIVDEITHRRLVAVLAARPRAGQRGRSPWVLTGFLRCERCGATLSGQQDVRGTRRYVCRKAPGYHGCGRLVIKAEPTEARLGDLVMLRLVDTDARRGADSGLDDDSVDLVELDEIEADIAALIVERGKGKRNGGIDTSEFRSIKDQLDARKAAANARIAARTRETTSLSFVIAEGYVGRTWRALDVDEQRTILEALIEHVTIGPATTIGSTKFETARVDAEGRIVWKA